MAHLVVVASVCALLQVARADLVFVIEQYRHGTRSPIYKYYDYEEQIQTAGQLTSGGMRQHYYLGRQMRKEYIEEKKFLSSELNFTEVFVRSTGVNRTMMMWCVVSLAALEGRKRARCGCYGVE